MSRATEEPEVEEREEVTSPAEARGAAETHDAPAEEEAFEEEQYEVAPDLPGEGASVAARRRPLYRRPVFLVVAALVLLAALLFGLRYWAYARSHETTDDAFIDGHIVQVSPKVSGYVAEIYVSDHQTVKSGDLIAELDSRDFEAKLDQAKAALDAGLAQQKQARTQVTLTRATTRANVQQAAAGVQQARSNVSGARAGAASERSRITQSTAGTSAAEANLRQAQADVLAAQAEATRATRDVTRSQPS